MKQRVVLVAHIAPFSIPLHLNRTFYLCSALASLILAKAVGCTYTPCFATFTPYPGFFQRTSVRNVPY